MTSKPNVNSKNNLEPGLYLVATPIGNMYDLSERACSILKKVDIIACEDTRVTKKLLNRHKITSQIKTYHEHNAKNVRPKLVKQIEGGKSVGLVSDAGTPVISDPGYKLVKECIERNLNVSAIPGPSAAISGLIISGLPTDRFFFVGFLKPKSKQKRLELLELSNIAATLVFFESNRRLLTTLQIMLDVLGDRPAAIAREMTKRHEEIRRDKLSSLIQYYQKQGAPKGEIVIIVGGHIDKRPVSDDKLDKMILEYLQNFSLRDTAANVALKTSVSKRRIYTRALSLQQKVPDKAF